MKPKYATLNKFHDQLVTVMLLEWCPENLPRNLPPLMNFPQFLRCLIKLS